MIVVYVFESICEWFLYILSISMRTSEGANEAEKRDCMLILFSFKLSVYTGDLGLSSYRIRD